MRTYLDNAEAQLTDNPDRAEIMADLEQAIVEKCQAFLGPHKNVVSAQEMEQVIKDMGPVDAAAGRPVRRTRNRNTARNTNRRAMPARRSDCIRFAKGR